MRQEQFLDVVQRDEAERRFRAAVDWRPLPAESVPVERARGRVLARDVAAPLDVPGFTRANVDGFAVRAEDTFGATEEEPRTLDLNDEVLATGVDPREEVRPGTATTIATGGMVPRGADAVLMVEDTDVQGGGLLVRRAVAPGAGLSHAGSDIALGETVLRAGDLLGSRETGILAALGVARVQVVRRPRVAVFSTGDEILAPGEPPRPGHVYDSNGRILADAVREEGGEPLERGVVRDDREALLRRLDAALDEADLVLFSGGTSKGAGDLSYRVVRDRGEILVHGVALKPGKPVCLAVVEGKPVAILPGFPTSAIFTFHELVAPWIRSRAGLPPRRARSIRARLPRAVVSERGRAEYDLVHLVRTDDGYLAYPLGKGSGSVTTFSRADGFYAIPSDSERCEAGEEVRVTLLAPEASPDLTVIGSHCTGLDHLLGELRSRGFTAKMIAAGSEAGLAAARRAECDLAGIHLHDPRSGTYNEPFVTEDLELVRGYGRVQGVAGRRPGRMINRNRGSGTRALVDGLLEGERPEGYALEVRSHQAVAAAVAAGRADWGVCIEQAARAHGLPFEPLAEERFDFVVPKARRDRPAVRAFVTLLAEEAVREGLARRGFRV